MAGFFSRLFNTKDAIKSPPPNKPINEDIYQKIADNQPHNVYQEALIFYGHRESIKHLTLINKTHFATASDDCRIIIWNLEKNSIAHIFDGYHTTPVNCMESMAVPGDAESFQLITLSGNEIVMWHLMGEDLQIQESTPVCIKDTSNSECFKCFCVVQHGILCTGGADVCLWDITSGKLLSRYERSQIEHDNSHVHTIIPIEGRNFGVIAASDYCSPCFYEIKKSTVTQMTQFHINFSDYLLCFHEGNITYLSPVSSNCFTTGALDGTLILWSINSLNAIKKFGLHSDDLSHSLSLTLSTTSLTNDKTVGRVMILCEKFIFAAVGNGFKVFDVFSSDRSGPAQSSHEIQSFYKPLMSHVNAHSDVVIDMEFVFESCMLLTASADHTVRLWRSCLQTPHNNKLDVTTDENAMKLSVETFLGLQDGNQTNRGKRKSQTIPMVPMLLGELTLHSDTVEKVRYLGKEFGIVTCGADGVVLIWKNLELEIKKKDSELTYQETYYDTL